MGGIGKALQNNVNLSNSESSVLFFIANLNSRNKTGHVFVGINIDKPSSVQS